MGEVPITARLCTVFIVLVLCSLAFPQAENLIPSIQHTPVISFQQGQVLEITANIPVQVDWVRIYFRTKDIEDFQVRNFDKKGSSYIFELNTSEIPGLEFEYFIEAVRGEEIILLPEGAPQSLFLVTGESSESQPPIPDEFPPPQEEAKKSKFKLPLNLTGSTETIVRDPQANPEAKSTLAAGNIRVFTNTNKNQIGLNLDSNFNYTNTPYEGDKSLDLSNMALTVTKANHTLTAGDINVSESEYTVAGLGRRGVEYTFNDQKAYFHLFNVNTQQPMGFSGFGIPRANVRILGGAAGYKLFKDLFSLKAIYLAGKDDPSKGKNVGFDSYTTAREGKVFALVEEATLFQNKLTLTGEYARSDYDDNLSDEIGSQAGTAWRLGGDFQSGIFSLGGNYRHVGKEFNPIGHQYFTNNRKSYDAMLGLNLKKVSINGALMNSRDNVEDDPVQPTTNSRNLSSNLMWTITDKVSFNLGYMRDKQKTTQEEGLFPFNQDSLSNQLTGSLNLTLGQFGNLSFTVTNADMSSKNNPQMDNLNLTMNLGGSIRAGSFFTIIPTFAYSRMINKYTNEIMKTYNSYANAEINFVPQLISLSLNGSFTRIEGSPQISYSTFNLMGNLNLCLQKIIKISNITLSLRGNYLRTQMMGITNSLYTLLLTTNFSF